MPYHDNEWGQFAVIRVVRMVWGDQPASFIEIAGPAGETWPGNLENDRELQSGVAINMTCDIGSFLHWWSNISFKVLNCNYAIILNKFPFGNFRNQRKSKRMYLADVRDMITPFNFLLIIMHFNVCVCVCAHMRVQSYLTFCDPMGCGFLSIEFSRQGYWSR